MSVPSSGGPAAFSYQGRGYPRELVTNLPYPPPTLSKSLFVYFLGSCSLRARAVLAIAVQPEVLLVFRSCICVPTISRQGHGRLVGVLAPESRRVEPGGGVSLR